MIYFPDSISSPFDAWKVGIFLLTTITVSGWGVRSVFAGFHAVMHPSGKD